MKNLKKELFDFNRTVGFEDAEVYHIVESHYKALDKSSEKDVIANLNIVLDKYKYNSTVRTMLENLNNDVVAYTLDYELKHLYRLLENKNQGGGMVYREAMRIVLEAITSMTDDEKYIKILNELAIHDWIPEVKMFVYNLTKSPEKRNNLTNGGNSEPLYTIVEKVEGGHLAYVKDAWFFLGENKIEKVLATDYITNPDSVRVINTLEDAMKYATLDSDKISIRVSESLSIGFSTSDRSQMFINEQKVEEESTLENIFSSSIVPIVNKPMYSLLVEVSKNLNKFVELDVVKKVYNLANPYCEQYVFNHNDNLYMYNWDTRFGNNMYKYESVIELIQDVQNESNYDITFFVENKLTEENKKKVYLEDKIKQIRISIDNIDTNLDKVVTERFMLGKSDSLDKAEQMLLERKKECEMEIEIIKETMRNEKEIK